MARSRNLKLQASSATPSDMAVAKSSSQTMIRSLSAGAVSARHPHCFLEEIVDSGPEDSGLAIYQQKNRRLDVPKASWVRWGKRSFMGCLVLMNDVFTDDRVVDIAAILPIMVAHEARLSEMATLEYFFNIFKALLGQGTPVLPDLVKLVQNKRCAEEFLQLEEKHVSVIASTTLSRILALLQPESFTEAEWNHVTEYVFIELLIYLKEKKIELPGAACKRMKADATLALTFLHLPGWDQWLMDPDEYLLQVYFSHAEVREYVNGSHLFYRTRQAFSESLPVKLSTHSSEENFLFGVGDFITVLNKSESELLQIWQCKQNLISERGENYIRALTDPVLVELQERMIYILKGQVARMGAYKAIALLEHIADWPLFKVIPYAGLWWKVFTKPELKVNALGVIQQLMQNARCIVESAEREAQPLAMRRIIPLD